MRPVLGAESHPTQPPNRMSRGGRRQRYRPTARDWSLARDLVLEQLRPAGSLVTVPDAVPRESDVNARDPAPLPPPLELVKQTTFAVMNPVTTAPDEVMSARARVRGDRRRNERASARCTRRRHQTCGVNGHHLRSIRCPRDLACNVFGHRRMDVGTQRSQLNLGAASSNTGIVEEPNVSTEGWIWIDTNC